MSNGRNIVQKYFDTIRSPSTGRSKPKRETMLSRSERIIGKQLKDESQEDEPISENSSKDSSSKRRGQVLKAQRAHRRRTQNYILELEKEVLRLRQREAEMSAELEQQRLNSGNSKGPSRTSKTNIENVGTSQQYLHAPPTVTIDLTEYERIEAGFPCSKAAFGVERVFPDTAVDDLAKLTDSSIQNIRHATNEVLQLDAQSAIDFILDLERPCLSHIKHDLTTKLPTPFGEPTFNYGRSHACTATAKIIQSCPNEDWANQKIQLPQQMVESLLANSRSLPLGPEMTPVQVWDMLTDIGKAQSLSAGKIKFVKEELSKYMRCNSFGSSIPIESLRRLMSFCFPWYDTTHLHDVHLPVAGPELAIMNETIGDDWNQFF